MNRIIPKNRTGAFTQQTVSAYKETNDPLKMAIIQLFNCSKKGITVLKISKLIEKIYSHYCIPHIILTMSKLVAEDVLSFKEKTIELNYPLIL